MKKAKSMDTFVIERTGDRPLQFDGEKIASATSEMTAGKVGNRWHELTLYRTSTGQFVLVVLYQTLWTEEMNHQTAWLVNHEKDLVEKLQQYDPADHVRGFPNYPQFQAKQEGLFRDIRARYEKAVSDLLRDLPEILT